MNVHLRSIVEVPLANALRVFAKGLGFALFPALFLSVLFLFVPLQPDGAVQSAFAQEQKSKTIKKRILSCRVLQRLKRPLPARCKKQVKAKPVILKPVKKTVVKKAAKPVLKKTIVKKAIKPAAKKTVQQKPATASKPVARKNTGQKAESPPKAKPAKKAPVQKAKKQAKSKASEALTGALIGGAKTSEPAADLPAPDPVPQATEVPVPSKKPEVVVASRLYARPDEFPPHGFKAYGIVVFRSLANDDNRERHKMICEAYQASLPSADDVGAPIEQQMVTIWPLDSVEQDVMDRISAAENSCELAVEHYGLFTAKVAAMHAGNTGFHLANRGPYLLAWAPPAEKGGKQAKVLFLDLSNVTVAAQARDIFLKWAQDIEADPEKWRDGWDIESIRITMRLWLDRYGEQVISLVTE